MLEIKDAIDGMSAREVERLIAIATERLMRCAICDSDGAERYRVRNGSRRPVEISFTLLLCRACVERHRLPPEPKTSREPTGGAAEGEHEDPLVE